MSNLCNNVCVCSAPVDAQNRDGSTPLQLATEADERDVVEAIVMRGHANLQLSRTNGIILFCFVLFWKIVLHHFLFCLHAVSSHTNNQTQTNKQ